MSEQTTDLIIDEIDKCIDTENFEKANILSKLFFDEYRNVTDFNERIKQKLPISYGIMAKNYTNKPSEVIKINYTEAAALAAYIHKDVQVCLRNLSNAKFTKIAKEIAGAYCVKHDIQEIVLYDDILKKILGDLK